MSTLSAVRKYRTSLGLGILISISSFAYLWLSDGGPNLPSIWPIVPIEQIRHYTPMTLGKRTSGPFFEPGTCSSSQFIAAIAKARVLEDGASRTVRPDDTGEILSLDDFSFSFDLGVCGTPHIFSSAEACDLLRAFGGMMVRGDSLTRHVFNAFMMLLTDRLDGAVLDEKEACRGEAVFRDGGICRHHIISDSNLYGVCGQDVHLFYQQLEYPDLRNLHPHEWQDWIDQLPPHKQSLSPIFFTGTGLHYNCDPDWAFQGNIRNVYGAYRNHWPRPMAIWSGIHAPGINKPEMYLEKQGPEPVARYNRRIGEYIDALSPQGFAEPGGFFKQINWFNVTDGAASYDGTHYSFQVNMEKALITLNVLDRVWAEVQAAGGVLPQ